MSGQKQKQAGAGNATPAAVAPRQTAATAGEAGLPQVPDQYAGTRAILKRHGLPQAWLDAAGAVHFDAAYVATLPADSLTLITAD